MATPIPSNRAPLTVWSAAAATGGRILQMGADGNGASGITSDSRSVRAGCAFVAIRGERVDGHDYVESAVRAGAVMVIVEPGHPMPPERIAALEVPDTLVAWGELARAHVRAWRRERPEARLVAVTGTAGKTTTKEICAALLGSAGPCHATAGNLNNRVGVPSVAFGLEVGHHFAVFEVGMSVPGEIDALARLLD